MGKTALELSPEEWRAFQPAEADAPADAALVRLAGEETVAGSVAAVAVGDEVLVEGVVLAGVDGHAIRRRRSGFADSHGEDEQTERRHHRCGE